LLQQHGAEAKLLAGGQSLVPMMVMRLARPGLLIDIHRIVALQSIQMRDAVVVTAAAVRQCTLEDDATVHAQLPLVAQAMRWVGYAQTRNRGTVGGSLVHADPSAELPLVALVLQSRLLLRSHGEAARTVDAADFFLAPMCTATRDIECLTAIEWPTWEAQGTACAFDEIAIRHGDFAMASAAAQIQVDDAGICLRAAFGLGGVDGVPRSFPELARHLQGQRLKDDVLRAVTEDAVAQCDPGSDLHASVEYRRHLARVLSVRVLRQAADAALRQRG